MTTGHLVVGPAEHGVVRCATEIYDALVAYGVPSKLGIARSGVDAPDVLRELATECRLVHVHFTDRLFGTPASQAAVRFRELASVADSLGVPLSVTLHDLPQRSDGRAWDMRVECYRAVADLCAGVAVSSRYERRLLSGTVSAGDEVMAGDEQVAVVPLMVVNSADSIEIQRAPETTVAILGFLYPGKGHIEVMNALSDMSSEVAFLALGEPSAGHEHVADELRAAAAESGRRCEITGFIPDDELRPILRQITVPIAHHRHMSASASINTWISARRRPLVARNPYTDEFDERSPGTVWLYDDTDEGLRQALSDALAQPDRTWIAPGIRATPDAEDVARRYSRLFDLWS